MSNQSAENASAQNDREFSSGASVNIELQNSWLTQNLYRLMLWISAAWFGVVLFYISYFFGWDNLFLMMPDEFGGFLAGITLPLAIIWVVVAYIDRGTSFKNEARFLRAYMNQLVYPEDGGAQTAKAMADALRSQVAELQEATRRATEQTEKIRVELGGRVEDFSKLVAVLDNYSSKTVGELSSAVKSLAETFNELNSQAVDSTSRFQNCASDLNASFLSLQKGTDKLLHDLMPNINEIKYSVEQLEQVSEKSNARLISANEEILTLTEKSNNNIAQASEILASQAGKIENISRRVAADCDKMKSTIDNSVTGLADVMQKQTDSVNNYINLLNQNADNLGKKFSEQGEIVGQEVDKIISRAHVAEESIALQVRELGGVSADIATSMQNVENNIRTQSEKLQKTSEIAVSNINTVVDALNKEASGVADIADKTIIKTTALSEDLAAKHTDMNNMLDKASGNLRTLLLDLNKAGDEIRRQTNDSANCFNDITTAMKKGSDSLAETSSIIVAQSKVSEAALAQQHRHINSSFSRIDEIKGELKREIDELTRASAVMNEDAQSAVNNLKDQMEQAIAASESVIAKTRQLYGELKEQTADFSSSTSASVDKLVNVNNLLEDQCQKIETVNDNIDKRLDNISKTLSAQTVMVSKATEDAQKVHNDILSSFSAQNNTLHSVTESTVTYVSDLVKALDEKAETISLLFKQQENEFFGICDKISENTNNIGSALKKQVSVIEQTADRAFSRLVILGEDVSKRSDNINENLEKSIDKLMNVNKAIDEQNSEVSNVIENLQGKLQLISSEFTEFTKVFNEIRTQAGNTSDALLDKCHQLTIANDGIGKSSQNIMSLMEGHIKNLDASLVKTQAQSDAIRETFQHQIDSLTDIVNVVSTQSRLGEASLAQQYKYLSDASAEAAAKVTAISEGFKNNGNEVMEQAHKIIYEFNSLGDKLIKLSEDVVKSAKTSGKSIEQISLSLNQTAEDLGTVVSASKQKVATVIKDYETYIAGFNTVTAEASTGVVEINNLISEQNNKMLQLSDGTKELVKYFNTVLNDTSKELSTRANQAYDQVKGLGESLKKLSLQVEETTKQSTGSMEISGNKLRASLSEVAANAERIANNIRSSGEVFLKQSEVLVNTSEDTIGKVSQAVAALSSTSKDFNAQSENILQRTDGFNVLFKKQLQILNETSGKAESKLQELEKLYEGMKVDNFLRNASYIVEKLEASAIDINRIFNPGVEEELWKKYYNGDTAAFVRHLTRTMSRSQIIAIKNEFEKNAEFRDIVTRYLTDFETLVSKAKDSEKAGLLLSVISGADVGKLYYILAKSLDRIN